LSQQPSTADEFVAHAALIAEVEAQRPAMDAEFDAVSAGPPLTVLYQHRVYCVLTSSLSRVHFAFIWGGLYHA
jgi:hypothetical protein